MGEELVDDQRQYCSVLIINETTTPLKLLIASGMDQICWMPVWGKIVLPGKEYLYRSENPFQFQLLAKEKNKEQETIVPPRMFKKDTLLRVIGSASDRKIAQEDLTEYPGENLPILLRRLNMEEESSADGGRNLFVILKIDKEELRRKPIEVQNGMIKKAFRREMLRWHPEQNPETGDLYMCQEIIVAYETLRHPESRARHNNAVDYDNGWLSASRWKAILWSECISEKQKVEYGWRMLLCLLSALSAAVGVSLVVSPETLVIAGTIVGGALNTVSLSFSGDAVVNSCDIQKYKESFIEGVKVGSLTGIAVIGLAKVGLLAEPIGADNGPIRYQVEKFVRTFLLLAIIFELLNSILQRSHSEGDDENNGASRIPEKDLTMDYLQTKYGLDETETRESSQAPDRHSGAMNTSQLTNGQIGYTTNGMWISRMIVQYNIGSNERKEEIVQGGGKWITLPRRARNIEIRFQVMRFPWFWCDVKKYDRVENRFCYPVETEVITYNTPPSCSLTALNGSLYYEYVLGVTDKPCHELDEIWGSGNGRIRYICKGPFGSRMTVEYTNERNERRKEVVKGSGRSVILPKEAKNIEVKFHVLRFMATWSEVKKYDRFRQCWVEPTEQHLFSYDVPLIRTFTIDGSLYYEYVSKVTDGTFQELNEM